MMHMLYMLDKPGQSAKRSENREDHLAYLGKFEDRVKVGGPLLSDDGQEVVGSLMIVEFEDREDLRKFIADEPFNKAGLFRSVTVSPWRRVIFRE